MIRVFVLYGQEPEPDRYAQHVELSRREGEPSHAYYAEWEFADEDAFKSGTRSDEFMATGKDAYKRGFPQPSVFFADVS